METFIKQSSINNDNNCYCIAPFNMIELNNKVNTATGRLFTNEDKNALQGKFKRYSTQKNCQIIDCCDPKDSYQSVSKPFFEKFKKLYPSVSLLKDKNVISKIILSKIKKNEPGWIDPTPYIVCKVSKSNITDTADPNIKEANNVMQDCFTDSCDNLETTILSLNDNSSNKTPQKIIYHHTSFDDARVTQSILEGNINYVKEYIRLYKSVDNKLIHDDYRNRMLHIAAKSNHEKILKMLLALKANPNVQNKENDTPLHFSTRHNQFNNTEELIKIGANLKIGNMKGETPIFEACRIGNPQLVRLLYNSGSNHYDTNNEGDNLINVCIKHCKPSKEKVEIVRFLIESGIDCENTNKSGKTTLELIRDLMDEEYKDEKYKIAANYITQTENFTVNEIDPEKMPLGKRTLLEIQTLVFNAIIKSNPDKYKDYVNVKDIPKGAPIEVVDHICLGEGNITGDEDSYECIRKGGRVIKMDEPTTKIKLELVPQKQSAIDQVKDNELYYKKIQDKININKTSRNLENYNENLALINTPPVTTKNLGSEILTKKEYLKEKEAMTQHNIETELGQLRDKLDAFPDQNTDITSDKLSAGDHPEFSNEDDIINNIPSTTKFVDLTEKKPKNDKEAIMKMLNDNKIVFITLITIIILIVLLTIFRKRVIKLIKN